MMFDPFLKLGISAILGLIIGLERELKRKPVGLKTCLVISISSCLLTIVSIESAYVFPLKDHITMDPLRLAAQIVSGVGFLGAGVILRRGNDSITGLTTAAIIWGGGRDWSSGRRRLLLGIGVRRRASHCQCGTHSVFDQFFWTKAAARKRGAVANHRGGRQKHYKGHRPFKTTGHQH